MAHPNPVRAPKVCAHAACGKVFRPATNYARTKYCSRACSVQARSRLSRVLAGRKGGRARSANYRESITRIRQAEYRRGYSDGWEACLREMERERRTA